MSEDLDFEQTKMLMILEHGSVWNACFNVGSDYGEIGHLVFDEYLNEIKEQNRVMYDIVAEIYDKRRRN